MAYPCSVVILGHIAGLPVQESLAYVAPVFVVVGWIYWASRRERRRGERDPSPVSAPDEDLDALLGPEPGPSVRAADEPRLTGAATAPAGPRETV